VNARGQQLAHLEEQERISQLKSTIDQEHQAMLDKLPEWKDEAKAKADKKAIADELLARGFEPDRVFGKSRQDGSVDPNMPGITDHKILLLARDAMLYRQMMSKAQTAAKKVSQLPQKVERPGSGESNGLDGRTRAMKQFSQTGSVRDAARVWEQIL
jgi:hypothetical protein